CLQRTLKDLMAYLIHIGRNEEVCFYHARAMGGKAGLKVNTLTRTEIDRRLSTIYKNRFQLGALKGKAATALWFKETDRPARIGDQMGSFKFMPKEEKEFEFDQIITWKHACEAIGLGSEEAGLLWDAWNDDGTV